MMLATKVILILALFHVALAQKQSCQSKIQSFYQSEDQYYDLECDRINDTSKKGLLHQCQSLQKKMNTIKKSYYDFGVSLISIFTFSCSKSDFHFRFGRHGQNVPRTKSNGSGKVARADKKLNLVVVILVSKPLLALTV